MYIGVSPGRFEKMRISLPPARIIDRLKVWDTFQLEPFRQVAGCPLAIHEAPQTSGIYIAGFHSYIKIGMERNSQVRWMHSGKV